LFQEIKALKEVTKFTPNKKNNITFPNATSPVNRLSFPKRCVVLQVVSTDSFNSTATSALHSVFGHSISFYQSKIFIV